MPECKGQFYRAACSTYRTKTGISRRVELKILKRKSCPGCEQCEWVYSEFGECEEGLCHVIFDHVENGMTYKPELKILSTDHETGRADDWEIYMAKVE